MDIMPELKLEISSGLNGVLTQRMFPGESVLVSLPGSFGEAFVVTNKRVIVLRDKASGLDSNCDVFDYPLSQIKAVQALASGTGGYIELESAEKVAEPDSARVYFPSYDLAKFQAAADYASKLTFKSETPAASGNSAAVGNPSSGGGQCPKCQSPVDPDARFCGKCGQRLRLICATCQAGVEVGSEYCDHCGMKLVEFDTSCYKCSSPIMRWMAFCPECGSIQGQRCGSCNQSIVYGWKYCASCGKQIGTTYINARHSSSLPFGLSAMKESLDKAAEPSGSSEPAEAPLQTGSVSAEEHNTRGRELFEADDMDGAVREFEAAVAADPGNGSYHCNLAVAYDEVDRDEDALAEYQKTLQIDPNDLTALLSLGYMYNEDQQPDKAQEYWGKVLSIAPDSAEAQEVRENLSNQQKL